MHLIKRRLRMYPRETCCFVTFTLALTDLIRTGFTEDERRRIQVSTISKFLHQPFEAGFMVLDEVQDCKVGDLQKICAMAGTLVVAGDGDQRIYDQGARDEDISRCLENPEIFELTEIHRLTQKIARAAKVILPGSRILTASIEDQNLKRGADLRLFKYPDVRTEVTSVWKRALDMARAGEPAVVFFSHHDFIDTFIETLAPAINLKNPPAHPRKYDDVNGESFNQFMADMKQPLAYYGNGFGSMEDSDERPMVYLMTYHSSKGLDFAHVFMPFLDRPDVPGHKEVSRELFFVAFTRSRFDLELSFSGARLSGLAGELVEQGVLAVQEPPKPEAEVASRTDGEDDGFFF